MPPMLLLPLLLLLPTPSHVAAAASASPTTMAVLPAGAVKGVSEALTVSEDLTAPGAPIVFAGASLRFELPKSGELQVSANATANWGNGGHVAPISNEEADIMGNAILWRDAADPRYDEIAELAPPALANKLRCGDYSLTGQTFIGSRIAAEKRSFDWTGNMNNDDIKQNNHFNTSQLQLNATYAGLLGGYMPALRWYFPLLPGKDYVEQISFAVPESSDDFEFDSHSIQPIWMRYLNVSASGELRYAHYVNTFETYPNCERSRASQAPAACPCCRMLPPASSHG